MKLWKALSPRAEKSGQVRVVNHKDELSGIDDLLNLCEFSSRLDDVLSCQNMYRHLSLALHLVVIHRSWKYLSGAVGDTFSDLISSYLILSHLILSHLILSQLTELV